MKTTSSFMQFLIALDQLLNTMTYLKVDGGFGMADETLSARAYRIRHKSNLYKVIDRIFFWQDEHCFNSYVSEILRKHLPGHYSLPIQSPVQGNK